MAAEAGRTGTVAAGHWTLHLDAAVPCDSTDRHRLGASPRRRLIQLGIGVTAVVLVVATGRFAALGVYAVTLLAIFGLAAGYSMSLEGDVIVTRRFSFAKRARLADVKEVRLYRYRSTTSLRLYDGAGKRLASISARQLGPGSVAATHLRHWLDRPDVTWGPGAWELVAPGAGEASAGAATASVSRPTGGSVPAKPPSMWAKVGVVFTLAMFLLGSIAFVFVVPMQWSDYELSQRIQHGPQVVGTLRSMWVTSTSDRYGTHHTTHFEVTFVPRTDGPVVTTEINAPGRYQDWPPGHLIDVRYEPGHPSVAELPGYPNHTLGGAAIITAVAAGIWVTAALTFRALVRARRRAKVATGSHGSASDRDTSARRTDIVQPA